MKFDVNALFDADHFNLCESTAVVTSEYYRTRKNDLNAYYSQVIIYAKKDKKLKKEFGDVRFVNTPKDLFKHAKYHIVWVLCKELYFHLKRWINTIYTKGPFLIIVERYKMSKTNNEDLHVAYRNLFAIATETVNVKSIVRDLFDGRKLNQVRLTIGDLWTEKEMKEHETTFSQAFNTITGMLMITVHLFILKYEDAGKVCMSDDLDRALVGLNKSLVANTAPLILEFEEQLESPMAADQLNRIFSTYCLSACSMVTSVCKSNSVNG